MINLIKMDFYRMLHIKSTYVILFLTTIFIGLSGLIIYVEMNNEVEGKVAQQVTQLSEDNTENINVGIAVVIDTKDGKNRDLIAFLDAHFQAHVIAIFLVIYVVMFISDEINYGYLKNIYGLLAHPGKMLVSKLIVLSFFTFLVFACSLLSLLIILQITLGDIYISSVFVLLQVLSGQFLLHMALVTIVIMLTVLLRNSAICITIASLLCMNVMTLLYSAVDSILQKVLGNHSFTLIKYTVTGNMLLLSGNSLETAFLRSIIVSICFIGLFLVAGIYIFTKRDIK